MRKSRRSQQGITFLGLVFMALVIGAGALVAMKAFPVVLEYRTITSLVNEAARSGGTTVQEVRADFDKRKTSQYGVNLRGADLEVSKDNERIVVSFEYEREIELIEPVYLLFKFKGRSR